MDCGEQNINYYNHIFLTIPAKYLHLIEVFAFITSIKKFSSDIRYLEEFCWVVWSGERQPDTVLSHGDLST